MTISLANVPDLDELHPTHRYAVEIVTGQVGLVCKRERQACERHLRDLQRQGTDEFPYVFDETRADRIIEWFERCCRHVRGPFSGQLIELLPFQKFDLGSVFGWVHRETGKRRFTISFNMRARGNVKSTEMSGVALYGLCGDCVYPPYDPSQRRFEESPEIECVAVDKEQAKRVWGDAKAMAEKSPDILKRLKVKRTYVEHKTRAGWMRAMSRETKNKDSGAPCLIIVDEWHAHPTSDVVDTVESGMGKRLQSLMMKITTAGEDAENKPCKKDYDYCCKILDGEVVNENYFVMIRELDKEDDPHDKSLWGKPNPVLRYDNEYASELFAQIEREYTAAFGSGDPTKIRRWMIKRVNCWQSDSENKYMSGLMDKWKALAVPRKDFLELIRGQSGYAGGDLSKRIDLTADAHVIPLDDGRYAITAHGFIPEASVAKHEHSDRVPYRHWAADGWCTITPGSVTDYSFVGTHLDKFESDNQFNVLEECYDPYNASHFMQEREAGGKTVVEIRQGVQTLSEPTKFFRELILQGRIVHDGSPLLTWCLSNAVEVVDNNGNIKLSKKHKDDSQRIDLAAAVIFAMVRAMVAEDNRSVYETRGLRRL